MVKTYELAEGGLTETVLAGHVEGDAQRAQVEQARAVHRPEHHRVAVALRAIGACVMCRVCVGVSWCVSCVACVVCVACRVCRVSVCVSGSRTTG